jgi:hypothetical protein
VEYEGYAAYARAAGITVVTHDRASWSDVEHDPAGVHRWYVSQPSAIDGNVWTDFSRFVETMEAREVEVAVDLRLCRRHRSAAVDRPVAA